NADVLVVTEVYPAREEPIQGITGELIVNDARASGHKEAYYVEDKRQLPAFLMKQKQPGDIVVTLGAGDISKYGEEFVALLSAGSHGKGKASGQKAKR
ncbi:MAG: UDP-N-acetylmuramate--L-alanine ligase, partial [Bacteroidetes bacterium]|nr:UDP-N-acetylmuramate--L-alanine ligase [Bacteroidota bacterium]